MEIPKFLCTQTKGMPGRHDINCCRFQRLFLRKAWLILFSQMKIYQMMIYHVIHTATRLTAPFGVWRHLESPYSLNWSVKTVFSGSCNTSIWYVDTVSIDYRYSSIVSTDTCRDLDSSYSSIWSITSLGDLSDVFEDQEKTEEGFDDVKSILV